MKFATAALIFLFFCLHARAGGKLSFCPMGFVRVDECTCAKLVVDEKHKSAEVLSTAWIPDLTRTVPALNSAKGCGSAPPVGEKPNLPPGKPGSAAAVNGGCPTGFQPKGACFCVGKKGKDTVTMYRPDYETACARPKSSAMAPDPQSKEPDKPLRGSQTQTNSAISAPSPSLEGKKFLLQFFFRIRSKFACQPGEEFPYCNSGINLTAEDRCAAIREASAFAERGRSAVWQGPEELEISGYVLVQQGTGVPVCHFGNPSWGDNAGPPRGPPCQHCP